MTDRDKYRPPEAIFLEKKIKKNKKKIIKVTRFSNLEESRTPKPNSILKIYSKL